MNPLNYLRRAGIAIRADVTLSDLMQLLAEVHENSLFVTEEFPDGSTRELTFDQAEEAVERWSVAIAARSPKGRPVVVATANGVDQFLLCLAVSRAGGLPAPVNPQMSPAEVDHVISDSGATLVIRDAAELARGKGSRSAPMEAATPEPSDVAALFYTSGTTGRPKGAALTHQALVGHLAAAAVLPLDLRSDEVVMALPVAHIMGFVAIVAPALAGVRIYFLDRFSPTRVLDAIEERRSSAYIGVPAMYRSMLERGAAERDLTSVRLWMSGADVMPASLAAKFKRFGASATLPVIGPIGEATFIEGYGMVEVGGSIAAKVSPPLLPIGLGDSLGVSMPGWKLRVADDEGNKVGGGQVGELQVRGPGVLKGYWGDPDASAAAMTDDGWLRTGDLVRSGPFGSVVFQGRAKAVIKSGGYSVYPLEVEELLEEHPDVIEAAVVGRPESRLGEEPVAAVRLAEGSDVSVAELLVWAGVRMAAYKAPREIVVVDELPRTGTRKVQRDRLLPLFSRN